MYLEKLEIQGFKSFANSTELVFNREMTAVVGPNGSGKSNTADAVRWVLGEQSSKTLRAKKSEDVIFAGSDKKGRLGYAEVSLYLNNQDRQADIDYEQIIITRKIERTGESQYFINNNKVRLLDVQLLLAKANFGQKTYSVIGQGMIDSILVSSAAERKEFFDEATGVKEFQIKKYQSLNKLNNAKENLVQTEQIMVELEPRLRSLTRQVKKLEKREKIEIELQELQTNYYSFLSNQLDGESQIKKKEKDVLQKEVSELNQKLIELQTKLEKEEKSASRQENFEILQKKLSQAQNELNSLLKERAILEGQADLKLMSDGKADVVWINKRIEELKNKINHYDISLKEQEDKLRANKNELAILEDKRNKILEQFKELENKLVGDDQEFSPESISLEVENILQEQESFRQGLEELQSLDSVPKLKEWAKKISNSIGQLISKIKQNKKQEDRSLWQEQFNDLLENKDNLVSEISQSRTDLAVFEHETNQIKNQVGQMQQELDKLETEKKAILENSGDSAGIKQEVLKLNEKIENKNQEIVLIEENIKEFNQQEEDKKRLLVEDQKAFREVQIKFNEKNNLLNDVKVSLARIEARQEDLEKEIAEEFSALKIKQVEKINIDDTREEILKLKNQLSIIGGIDEEVIDEYQEVNERFTFLSSQSEDLHQAIKHLEKIIKDLEESISKQFDQGFKNINKLFNQYFQKLFSGGKAELILDISEVSQNKSGVNDSEEAELDDEDEKEIKKQYGIEIKAVPPGKKLSSINMLSGGEKALTSIALICAIIANSPSPFVVLDEVDAALDEANSIRFSEILAELSSQTQFIAITHNRATMHQAKIIYGVTMDDDGVSRLLSINFEEADEIAA